LHQGRTMDEWNRNRPVRPEHTDFRPDAVERERKRRERDERRKKSLDDRLDLGLEETFPGSDPVAVTQPPASPYDKPRR
jgi:hypothetical protein